MRSEDTAAQVDTALQCLRACSEHAAYKALTARDATWPHLGNEAKLYQNLKEQS